jgi:hypothetical protein
MVLLVAGLHPWIRGTLSPGVVVGTLIGPAGRYFQGQPPAPGSSKLLPLVSKLLRTPETRARWDPPPNVRNTATNFGRCSTGSRYCNRYKPPAANGQKVDRAGSPVPPGEKIDGQS